MLVGVVGTFLSEADPLAASFEISDFMTGVDLVAPLFGHAQLSGSLSLHEKLLPSEEFLLVGDGDGIATGALGRHREVLALLATGWVYRRALHLRW